MNEFNYVSRVQIILFLLENAEKGDQYLDGIMRN